MNKKYAYAAAGLVVLLLLFFIVPKYFARDVTASGVEISGDIEKIEISHFHATSQCSSCIAVGDLAEKTINTYFLDELESGKIIFGHINAELPQNRDKVIKYGATGSSLWIGVYYKDGSFTKEENVNVWYKINNKKDYMNYFKGVIEGKLSGN